MNSENNDSLFEESTEPCVVVPTKIKSKCYCYFVKNFLVQRFTHRCIPVKGSSFDFEDSGT